MKNNLHMVVWVFFVLGVFGLLSGCTTYGTIPGEMFNAAASGTTVIATEASQQDAIRGQAVQERDKQRATAYKNSGFQMTMAVVTINGIPAYMPSSISFREQLDFGADLSQNRQHHRAWQSLDTVVGAVAKYGLIGYGMSELSGIVTAGFDAAKGTGDTIIASDQATLILEQQRSQQSVTAGNDAIVSNQLDKQHDNMAGEEPVEEETEEEEPSEEEIPYLENCSPESEELGECVSVPYD